VASNPSDEEKPFSARTALLLVLSTVTALVAGGLFYLGTGSVPLAVFTGGATFGAAWVFFDRLIK
jgi:hypothetical protein